METTRKMRDDRSEELDRGSESWMERGGGDGAGQEDGGDKMTRMRSFPPCALPPSRHDVLDLGGRNSKMF
eukprot:471400-Hanusia_phi.AAC.8